MYFLVILYVTAKGWTRITICLFMKTKIITGTIYKRSLSKKRILFCNFLGNILVKSKIPPLPNPYSKRNLSARKKCSLLCTACPYILQRKCMKIDGRNTSKIERKLKCKSFNIICILECQKWRQKFIRTTGWPLKLRLG